MISVRAILEELPLPLEVPLEGTGMIPHLDHSPRVVLFDVYGTLVSSLMGDLEQQHQAGIDVGSFLQTARRFGFSDGDGRRWAELFYQLVDRELKSCAAAGVQRAEVLVDHIWRSLLLDVGGDPDRFPPKVLALFREMSVNPVALFTDVRTVLAELKSRGLILGLASNAQFYTPLILQWLLKTPLQSYFDPNWIFFSYRFGFAKPDPHFFRLILNQALRTGLDPGDVLVVGNDLENDIRAASLHGLQTVLFAPGSTSRRQSQSVQSKMVSGFIELGQALIAGRRSGNV
jgi:putative hydrolase of the HAD superfamily